MIIGLTGGIGSGKSTIAHGLEQLGYTIYDTDREAKRIIETDAEVRTRIKHLLGDDCFDEQGHYQTSVVAGKVFRRPDLLQALNAIVHPAVEQDILNSTTHANISCSGSKPLPLIIESAILFESGLYKICDKTITVTAPEETRIARVLQRDKTNIDNVRARMQRQMSDAERTAKADIVVNNDGQATIDQLCLYIKQHL